MEKTTIYTGVLLIVVGLGASLITGQPTAAIPAPFGVLIALFGFTALKKENLKKHMIHAAVVLALLGVLATFTGVVNGLRIIAGAEVVRPLAALVQTLMFVVCAGYVTAAVRSFIAARKK